MRWRAGGFAFVGGALAISLGSRVVAAGEPEQVPPAPVRVAAARAAAEEEKGPRAAAGVAVDAAAPDVEAVPPPAEPDWQTAPALRRSGFAAVVSFGAHLGAASGFPNDALQIDRPELETNTGFAIGGSPSLFVGGALADWVSFGLSGSVGRMVSADHQLDFFSIGFRTELFPAFSLGGAWQDVGLLLDTGLAFLGGTATADDSVTLIDSGGASRVGLGVFYEGFRVWKVSTGPFASFDVIWSPSSSRPTAWVGWRTSLYTGP